MPGPLYVLPEGVTPAEASKVVEALDNHVRVLRARFERLKVEYERERARIFEGVDDSDPIDGARRLEVARLSWSAELKGFYETVRVVLGEVAPS